MSPLMRIHNSYEVCDKEPETPRVTITDAQEHVLEDHDMVEPHKPVYSPQEVVAYKRTPAWDHKIIQDAEKYGALDGSFKERKRPRIYSNYMALLSKEPSNYTKEIEKKVWKDAILEEY
jgi:hypothetical protein